MMITTQLFRANAIGRVLALSVVATMGSLPAAAMNRAARLHGASHPAGHVVATRHAESTRSYDLHGLRYDVADRRHTKRGAKAAGKADLPASRTHAKDSRHKHHEPDPVDEPVVMHRASARGHKLTKRERTEELAEARYNAEMRYEAARRTHAIHVAPAPQQVAIRQPEDDSSRYGSKEFTASFSNVRRGVDQAVRPNAYARRAQDAQIGTALRTDGTDSGVIDRQPSQSQSDAVADQARRSSVVVRHALPSAQIAPSDAPLPSQRYQPRVATGFGAEVAPLPSPTQRNAASNSALTTEAQDLGEDLAADALPSARTLADDATQPLVTPMYSRSGSLMMPAPLRGSHEVLVHQNIMADHDGLERIRDDYQLNRLRAGRELVNFPLSASLRINESLPDNRRVARPWTVKFAADAAREFYSHFGEPLTVTSAVRTVSYQLRLQRVNGNAAAIRGEGASPHLTGQAIDLAKRGMTSDEIAWMRTYLLPFIDAGKVDVEEEFQQACFHISVYRSYMPAVRRQAMQVAQVRALPATASTSLPVDADTER